MISFYLYFSKIEKEGRAGVVWSSSGIETVERYCRSLHVNLSFSHADAERDTHKTRKNENLEFSFSGKWKNGKERAHRQLSVPVGIIFMGEGGTLDLQERQWWYKHNNTQLPISLFLDPYPFHSSLFPLPIPTVTIYLLNANHRPSFSITHFPFPSASTVLLLC